MCFTSLCSALYVGLPAFFALSADYVYWRFTHSTSTRALLAPQALALLGSVGSLALVVFYCAVTMAARNDFN